MSDSDDLLTWEVKSETTKTNYTVSLECETCPQHCAIRCTECNICVHMFTCNCPDALIRATICKLIHLIARYRSQNTNSTPHDSKTNADEVPHHDLPDRKVQKEYDETSLLNTLQEKTELCEISTLKNEVQTEISVLSGHIRLIQDKKTLKDVRHYIISAMNIIKVRKTPNDISPNTSTRMKPANINKDPTFQPKENKRKQKYE